MEPDYNDERVLATRLKQGSASAFDYFFRTRHERACRFAVAIVNDTAAAEDIVQEVFSAIWTRARWLDERKPVDNYLFISVRNACLNYLRDKKPRAEIDEAAREESPDESPDDDPRIERARRAIERLPSRCKLIFKLVVWEEMSYRDVANRLDLSLNTVKTQIKIAYRTLREELSRFK
ncbi:MAG: RNA polymerase sigma-70 factor [Odoribacteraceae bacterium]|jgi:RNA polymerase sigma-70 factor (ECF subfamily)|nr:RNA polymerase sigma-70 factor [Odoribacteraceae bacterium]